MRPDHGLLKDGQGVPPAAGAGAGAGAGVGAPPRRPPPVPVLPEAGPPVPPPRRRPRPRPPPPPPVCPTEGGTVEEVGGVATSAAAVGEDDTGARPLVI